MKPEETLKFIVDRYKLDLTQPNPIIVEFDKWRDIGALVNDLDFKVGLELGVYKGALTQTIASRAPNMKLYGVDAWTGYDGYIDYPSDHLETVAYTQAKERASRYPNVELVKGWSKDVAPNFADGSLDFIYIDANHTYPCIKEDLSLWVSKVKTGGIVMGHDYFDTSKSRRLSALNFGVVQAVNEWVADHNINHLFRSNDRYPSWWFVQGDLK